MNFIYFNNDKPIKYLKNNEIINNLETYMNLLLNCRHNESECLNI